MSTQTAPPQLEANQEDPWKLDYDNSPWYSTYDPDIAKLPKTAWEPPTYDYGDNYQNVANQITQPDVSGYYGDGQVTFEPDDSKLTLQTASIGTKRSQKAQKMNAMAHMLGSNLGYNISRNPALATPKGAERWISKQPVGKDGYSRYWIDTTDLDGDNIPELSIRDRNGNYVYVNGNTLKKADTIWQSRYLEEYDTPAKRKAMPYAKYLQEKIPFTPGEYGIGRIYDEEVYKDPYFKLAMNAGNKTHVNTAGSARKAFQTEIMNKLIDDAIRANALAGHDNITQQEEHALVANLKKLLATNFKQTITGILFYTYIIGKIYKDNWALFTDIMKKLETKRRSEQGPYYDKKKLLSDARTKFQSYKAFKQKALANYIKFYQAYKGDEGGLKGKVAADVLSNVSKAINQGQITNQWGETIPTLRQAYIERANAEQPFTAQYDIRNAPAKFKDSFNYNGHNDLLHELRRQGYRVTDADVKAADASYINPRNPYDTWRFKRGNQLNPAEAPPPAAAALASGGAPPLESVPGTPAPSRAPSPTPGMEVTNFPPQ